MNAPLPAESRVLREEAPLVPDTCGLIATLTTRDDYVGMNLALVTVKGPARCHLHRTTVEIYYVLEGRGEVWVDGATYPVSSGDRVILKPGDCHRLVPYLDFGPMRVLVAASPAWCEEDEILCERHAPAS